MIRTFLVSFRLKNTYRVNTIIYSLKRLPFIKKLLPVSLYKSNGLKIFANILSVIWEFISMFMGKTIYLVLMFLVPMSLFEVPSNNSFFHIFLFLTLIGGFFNTGMLSPSLDKYYAVILMRMNSHQFALSNYSYTLLRHFLGFLACFSVLTVSKELNISFGIIILLSMFVCSVKLIVMQYFLYDYKQNHRVHNENNQNKYTISLALICLAAAYGLPFIKIVIPSTIIIILMSITFLLGINAFIYVFKYKNYHQIYHDLLSSVVNILNTTATQMVNENYHKMITLDTSLTSQKKGFEFFNDIFVKRHKRLLWKSAKRQSYIILVIVVITCVILYCVPNVISNVQNSVTMMLPYFVFIMYLLNTTKTVTQAMFINCDHSMLTYAFYRQPHHILSLFKIRLRDMIKINLVPASLIALGMVVILMIIGGQNIFLNSVVFFVSILSMSIFFSTHYLVLYYLLQPYNAFTEVTSPMYSIITSGTYIVCFLFTKIQLPLIWFGMTTIIFCVLYCFIAFALVYKYAEKTFMIHN